MSATRNEHGEFRIDEAELARVFAPETRSRTETVGCRDTADQTDLTSRNAALETEVRMLREKGELMREMLNKIEADRDAWKGQAERLALAGPARRSWWPWKAA